MWKKNENLPAQGDLAGKSNDSLGYDWPVQCLYRLRTDKVTRKVRTAGSRYRGFAGVPVEVPF